MSAKRTVAVVTTSRADYSHLYSPLGALAAHPDVELKLIVLGAHLSPEYGTTVREIERDGFSIDERIECLLSSDTDIGMAKTMGLATLGLADVLGKMRPDILLLIADRYEMLAPASVAVTLRIPIAHIEGGEVSEGAIDDAIRNALTKLSHIHFTPTETARRRVIALGEAPWRVHRVGAPSIDLLHTTQLLDRPALERRLGVTLRNPLIVASYHPVTLLSETTAEANAFFTALGALDGQILFCYPNADAGARDLVQRADAFCRSRSDAQVFINLSPVIYWSLLSQADVLVGNSSSGIMEAPSLALPCVNVGIRQQGRERAANIIDVPADASAIVQALQRASDPVFRRSLQGMSSPYGDGDAGQHIADVLGSVTLGPELIMKQAPSLHEAWRYDGE